MVQGYFVQEWCGSRLHIDSEHWKPRLLRFSWRGLEQILKQKFSGRIFSRSGAGRDNCCVQRPVWSGMEADDGICSGIQNSDVLLSQPALNFAVCFFSDPAKQRLCFEGSVQRLCLQWVISPCSGGGREFSVDRNVASWQQNAGTGTSYCQQLQHISNLLNSCFHRVECSRDSISSGGAIRIAYADSFHLIQSLLQLISFGDGFGEFQFKVRITELGDNLSFLNAFPWLPRRNQYAGGAYEHRYACSRCQQAGGVEWKLDRQKQCSSE